MTEQRAPYPAYPVDEAQLAFVLSVLSMHQLVHLASRVRRVCKDPGFGKVTITILRGHPAEIEAGASEKLLPRLDAQDLDELMR